MKTVKAQLFVTVEIQIPDDADYDQVRDIINELDYDFQDTTGDANVVDSCIDDFVTDFEEGEDNDLDTNDLDALSDREYHREMNDEQPKDNDDDDEQPELSPDEKAHVSPIVP